MISSYKVPLDEVDALRAAHQEFLAGLEEKGVLASSGRRTPPVGGVVILTVSTEEEARAVMARDPYVLGGVADYEPYGYHAARGVLRDGDPRP